MKTSTNTSNVPQPLPAMHGSAATSNNQNLDHESDHWDYEELDYCPTCGGDGMIVNHMVRCPNCRGSGMMKDYSTWT